MGAKPQFVFIVHVNFAHSKRRSDAFRKMLKIITLAIVFLTVVLLHGANGGPVRRQASESFTTGKPKLIRVRLHKWDPNKKVVNGVADADAGNRSKRAVPDEDLEFFGGHRSPVMKSIQSQADKKKTDDEPTEDFFRAEMKGFEARELEEKLAEIGDVVDDAADVTDGRTPTDDENQRFDVETTTSKVNRLEEIQGFFGRRHECDRNF